MKLGYFTLIPGIAVLAACEMPAPTAANDPAATAGPAASQEAANQTADVPMPPGLNAEERLIWNSLTPAARRQAAEFIANGGTLTQFVST